MKKILITAALIAAGGAVHAQSLASDIGGLQGTLNSIYNDMLPMCSQLIGTGRAIAGFGALWYIASRVWRQIANAEAIDLYPLLRPFAIGLAILLFPTVVSVVNGVLSPTVSSTQTMVRNSDAAIQQLLAAKQKAVQQTSTWQMYVGASGEGDRDKWYKYTHPGDTDGSGDHMLNAVGNDMKFAMAKAEYGFRNSIKEWMSEVLQVLFEAAALCINTIRTFYLIVLAILGPLVLGLSVFDGFQHTLTAWLAKYINVFLWLPIANIFGAIIGKVQENMLKIDIAQVQSQGDTFFNSTDTAYLIFLLIGIAGYFTVPSIANYVVNAGGGNGLLQKVNTMVSHASNSTMQAGGALGDRMQQGAENIRNLPKNFMEGYNGKGNNTNNYQENKLSGK